MLLIRQLKVIKVLRNLTQPIIFNLSINPILLRVSHFQRSCHYFSEMKNQTIQESYKQQIHTQRTVQEIIEDYQLKKQQLQIKQMVAIIKQFNSLLWKKQLNKKEKQLILEYTEKILVLFIQFLKTIPINGLLIGHRANKKKYIVNMVSFLCFQGIKIFFYGNQSAQNVNKLIRNETLANILLQNFHILSLRQKSYIMYFFHCYHKNNKQYIQQLKQKISQANKYLQKNLNIDMRDPKDILSYIENINHIEEYSFKNNLLSEQFRYKCYQQIIQKISQMKLRNLTRVLRLVEIFNHSTQNRKLVQKFLVYQKKRTQQDDLIDLIQKIKVFSYVYRYFKGKKYQQCQDLLLEMKSMVKKNLQFLLTIYEKQNNQLSKAEISLKQIISSDLTEINLILLSMLNLQDINYKVESTLQNICLKNLQSAKKKQILQYISFKIQMIKLKMQKLTQSEVKEQLNCFKTFAEKFFDKLLTNKNLYHNNIEQIYKKTRKIPYQSSQVQKKINQYKQKFQKINQSNLYYPSQTFK